MLRLKFCHYFPRSVCSLFSFSQIVFVCLLIYAPKALAQDVAQNAQNNEQPQAAATDGATATANIPTSAPSTTQPSASNPGTSELPPALFQEERYELEREQSSPPSIESQAFERDYPQAPPTQIQNEEEDDFLFKTQKRVENLLVSNVGIQNNYRPAHRFGLWAGYSSSVLAKALYRSSEDSGLISSMKDSGMGLGVQMDFSWVERPDSPQPSNSSLRVRAGLLRSKIEPTPVFLNSSDPSTLESAMNVFHVAFLLKNALPLMEGVRSWGGGGVFLNYVLWTDRPRLQSDPSSNILNSLAFGPMLSMGFDFEVGRESELLVELDYNLFKSFGVQVGMKTSL